MDPFEKKIKGFYTAIKQEDEKYTPDFNSLLNRPLQVKTTKWPNLFLKIAAAVLVIAGAASYYFYNSSSNRFVSAARDIPLFNPERPLPTEVLLNNGPATEYIWEWNAPTDKLLDNVNQSLNTIKNPNL